MEIVSIQKNLTNEDILAYYDHTDKSLSNIHLFREAITCSDVNCKDVKHKRDFCSMYNDIVSTLKAVSPTTSIRRITSGLIGTSM